MRWHTNFRKQFLGFLTKLNTELSCDPATPQSNIYSGLKTHVYTKNLYMKHGSLCILAQRASIPNTPPSV